MAMVYYSPRLGFWEPVAGLGVSKDYFKYGDTGQKYEKPFYVIVCRTRSACLPGLW